MSGKRRRITKIILSVVLAAGVFAFIKWKEAGERGGQVFAEPFRIAGNFYFVGANDISAFLITTPAGHILLDGGYPRTPTLIMTSIRKLGFDIKDVKILINSETHYDHAGGLAELQKASGAQVYASESSAGVMESGGDDPSNLLPLRALVWMHITRYPPIHVDHHIKDGDTISLGGTTLTAHLTPGHEYSEICPPTSGSRLMEECGADIANSPRAKPQRILSKRSSTPRVIALMWTAARQISKRDVFTKTEIDF